MTGHPFVISDAHPLSSYRESFLRDGRLHVPQFLAPDSAEAMHHALAARLAYQLFFLKGDQPVYLKPEQMSRLSMEQRNALRADVDRQATHQFQYAYERASLSNGGEINGEAGSAVRDLAAFINSEPFLRFARAVTGRDDIAFADGQATRYRRGAFLTEHSDDVPNAKRIAAYVINLTKDWKADWGGLLLFPDENGHVTGGFTPRFNAINIFQIPSPHFVSQVSSFAGADRLSITGWFRKH